MIVLILHMLLNEFKNYFISSLTDHYPKSEITAFYRRLTDFYFQWSPTFSVLNPQYQLNKKELQKLFFALDELKKSDDVIEGVKAFKEKRLPKWK